jgi:outer membrane protein OmpA-like peptidoglycan-associated protein
MVRINNLKILLIALFSMFYAAVYAENPPVDRMTLVTDESWEVSKGQPTFGEGPLSIAAVFEAQKGFKGGNAQAVVANFYGSSTLIKEAKPIWLTKKASNKFESRQFKKVFMLRNNLMQSASIQLNCDDAARLYINGQLVGKNLNRSLNMGWVSQKFNQLSAYFYDQIYTYDIKPYLVAGALNTILVEVASEEVDNGHAYLCARLDVDFIEKTIALKSEKPVAKPTVKPDKKPTVVPKKTVEKVVVAPTKETPVIVPQVVENEPIVPVKSAEPTVFKTSNDVNVAQLKIGDIFELGNIYFKADDYQLNGESQGTLLELATFLKANSGMKIEIGGHTNLLPTNEYAYKLSSERAKSVMDFLMQNGVAASKLSFKGYGKSKPKLMEKSTSANQKNQRVEVKILSK